MVPAEAAGRRSQPLQDFSLPRIRNMHNWNTGGGKETHKNIISGVTNSVYESGDASGRRVTPELGL